jgi:hypothetical protein
MRQIVAPSGTGLMADYLKNINSVSLNAPFIHETR